MKLRPGHSNLNPANIHLTETAGNCMLWTNKEKKEMQPRENNHLKYGMVVSALYIYAWTGRNIDC